jgi:opacity protein-like surface antigen
MKLSAACLLLTVTALAAAAPVKAQSPAPASSGFDGTYVGVSAENNSSRNTLAGGHARTQGYPARLTITGDHARVRWGDRVLEGDAGPDGSLTMTTGYGQKFDGRIDAQQMIKGQLVGYCAYGLTWRKQG